jgi:hypothetical protein
MDMSTTEIDMSTPFYTWTTVNEDLCNHGEDAVEQILGGPTGQLYSLAVLALDAARRDIIKTLEEDAEALDNDPKVTETITAMIAKLKAEVGSEGWTQNEPAPSRVMFTRQIEAADTYSYSIIRLTVIE